jgi:intermediate filament protein if
MEPSATYRNNEDVTGEESLTMRTSSRHHESQEKVDLMNLLHGSHFENGGGPDERAFMTRTPTKYEIDPGSKTTPKIIMINRTEPQKPQDRPKPGTGGSYVETTLSFKISSKQTNQPDVDVRDGFQKVISNWSNEKKNLQGLNERLGNYIEKARFLEQQNKTLKDTLEQLRRDWVKETMKVKEEYTDQLKDLRKALENAESAKVRIQVQLASLDDRYNSLLKVFEDAQQRNLLDAEEIARLKELIEEYESELNLLRKRVAAFDADKEKDLRDIQRLRQNIENLRIKLDEETENHILAEHAVQNNKEAMEFMKAIHEAELKELEGLFYKDNTSESKSFWKNELSQALEEIQAEYDSRVEDVKIDMEILCEKTVSQVNNQQPQNEDEVKTNEELKSAKENNSALKNKCRDLESQIPELQEKQRRLLQRLADLRHQLDELRNDRDRDRSQLMRQIAETQNELDQIMSELKTLLDNKLSLDLQIAAYRKLLEGEEARDKRDPSKNNAHDMVALLLEKAAEAPPEDSHTSEVKASPTKKQKTQKPKSSAEPIPEEAPPAEKSSEEQPPAESSELAPAPSMGSLGDLTDQTSRQTTDEPIVTTNEQSEMTAKTTFRRTTKGVIAIKDCGPDGKFVRLFYSSKKTKRREDLSNWKLIRTVDEQQQVAFTFPEGVIMEPEGELATIVVWAAGAKPLNASVFDLEMPEPSWGMGANVNTVLFNQEGEEKAAHVQQTALSSV